MDEDDMVEPNVSTLDLLKAQRARKAAAMKAQEESETESETEDETTRNPLPTSENAPPASERALPASKNPPPASENPLHASKDLSWNFVEEAAVPPGLRRKDLVRMPLGDTAQHNSPVRSENAGCLSTLPVASTSAAIGIQMCRAPSSEPLKAHAFQASQASQQLHAHQSRSTQKSPFSSVGKSGWHKKSGN